MDIIMYRYQIPTLTSQSNGLFYTYQLPSLAFPRALPNQKEKGQKKTKTPKRQQTNKRKHGKKKKEKEAPHKMIMTFFDIARKEVEQKQNKI
jgi:hypothetical protein